MKEIAISAVIYNNATQTPAVIIRMPDLVRMLGIRRSTIYKRLATDPTFPRPVSLSDSNARGAPIGFVLSEVQTWISKKIEHRDA